jgi:two-component system chemotaxis sensor kinase CheA
MSDLGAAAHEFVGEAKEHLANITDDLLALEQGHAANWQYRLHRLFRALHSIKGGAGFFGFTVIADLSHLQETILEHLRRQPAPPTPATVDVLLGSIDRLAALIDDIDHSNQADLAEVRARLTPLLPGTLAPTGRATLRTLSPQHPFDGQNRRFLLTFDLHDLFARRQLSPVRLLQTLQAHGQLLAAQLDTAGADLTADPTTTPVIYDVLYATPLPLADLARTTGLPADAIEALDAPAPPPVLPAPVADTREPDRPVPAASAPGLAPATTVRLRVELLDRLMTCAGELVLVRNQALLAVDQADLTVRRILQRLNAVTSELQATVMLTRMQPVGNLFSRFPRLVRDLARQLGKQIELTTTGSEVELDKTLLEALADPLTHLLRNGCDHGIELPAERVRVGKPTTGQLELHARHDGGHIYLTLRDDGRGIDPQRMRNKAVALGVRSAAEVGQLTDTDALALILLPGFSTAEVVTDVSGRGVGMDVVKTNLEHLGGALEIHSTLGHGTAFQLRLPLTVAIIPCLLVESGGERYAIPQKDLDELVCLYPHQAVGRIEYTCDQEVYRLRERLLPLVRLNEVLARRSPFNAATRAEIADRYRAAPAGAGALLYFAVVKANGHRYGLIVERILSTEEIVVKPMQTMVKGLRCFSGATILGDGQVALIVDTEGIARHVGARLDVADLRPAVTALTEPSEANRDRQTVLLFRSGPSEQFALAVPMIRRIEMIAHDRIERVGQREFVTISGTPTLILRLERLLQVSPCPEQASYCLLLPRNVRRPVGILLATILDTAELTTDLTTDGYHEPGVLGTAQVRGRMTIFLDIFALVDRLERPVPVAPTALVAASKPRVLLVDDTQFFRQLVGNYLTAEGFTVVTANHGAAGLEQFDQNGPFALVVSDIEMPIMDGWSLAQAIRQRPTGQQVPLLALTTLSSAEDRERARTCGFNAYEVKVDRESLLGTVAHLLGRVRATA